MLYPIRQKRWLVAALVLLCLAIAGCGTGKPASEPITLSPGEYFVNELRDVDNELSNADCSVTLREDNRFMLYLGWGQWYAGQYEIREKDLLCTATVREWDGGGGAGDEPANVLFRFEILEENKIQLKEAKNNDPTSDRKEFGNGFEIGMTYSKKDTAKE